MIKSMADKLRHGVTFLPLKDLRYTKTPLQGHTWFMSSVYDTHVEDEVQYQKYPSEASRGRILCIKGHDTHDGSRNYYALAWPEFLPFNATVLKGLTFISHNHYNDDNTWHDLSSMPRIKMGLWLRLLMKATLDGPIYIEGFDGLGHGDGKEMGTGDRSFRNETAVVKSFKENVSRLMVAGEVDQLGRCIGITSRCAANQHDPEGWLKLAGVGQYAYHWIASWSGMKHKGGWLDPIGAGDHASCHCLEDDRRCMSIYKNAQIGHNET
ncbi:hypothetical protein Ancab_027949 [Ancistrocladus abbreviatus]